MTHLFGVKNSPELREAYETVLGEMVSFGLKAKQSEPIFQALQAIKNGDQWNSLDEAQQRIVDHKLLDARLAGVGLSGEQRDRFNRSGISA